MISRGITFVAERRENWNIEKDLLYILIRWLNYANGYDGAWVECFRKTVSKLNFQWNSLRLYRIFRSWTVAKHAYPRGKETGGLGKTLKEKRTMEETYEYGELVTFKPPPDVSNADVLLFRPKEDANYIEQDRTLFSLDRVRLLYTRVKRVMAGCLVKILFLWR